MHMPTMTKMHDIIMTYTQAIMHDTKFNINTPQFPIGSCTYTYKITKVTLKFSSSSACSYMYLCGFWRTLLAWYLLSGSGST